MLSTFDLQNDTRFFAVRVQEGNEVSLHDINALPTIGKAAEGRDGYNNVHCGGCRDGNENRYAHICEARS